eukprot:TRINITY_DN3234_c0_g1_i4.p1 TRINITY_DN3234_c0_g1~~TRINITY_DN3234_c0_g1_i4.p1  ORF type:complete len:987 (+),score=198.48 TRINITY_DN3234_c0_g1_i4:49-3009(+)
MQGLVPLPWNVTEEGNARRLSESSDAESVPSHLSSSVANNTSSMSSFRLTHAYKERSARLSDLKNQSKAGKEIDPDLYANLRPELEMDEHTLSVPEIIERFQTHATNGLTMEEVQARLLRYGPNRVTNSARFHLGRSYWKHLTSGFALLLWAAALFCIVAYSIDGVTSYLSLGLVLIWLVLAGSFFTSYHESEAHTIMENFRRLIPQSAVVRRDGLTFRIDAKDLVPGDIVIVKEGDKIPADMRVISSKHFKVDVSALTGESEPQPRFESNTSENPLETKNLLFYSCLVTDGEADGVVISTGERTFLSRLAASAMVGVAMTPFRREIDRLIRTMSISASVIGILFFFFGMIFVDDIVTNFVFAVGIIVANVPEGLLATVTVSLKLSARRMASKSVLVKNLDTVETLGCTSTIATDKTGTITQNKMAVSEVWAEDRVMESWSMSPTVLERNKGIWKLVRAAALCNRAYFDTETMDLPVSEREAVGDASDVALLRFAESLSPAQPIRDAYPRLREVPFNSHNMYHITLHVESESHRLVVIKGAPEKIVEKCSNIHVAGKIEPMTPAHKEKITQAFEGFGMKGGRVLGFAQASLDNRDALLQNLEDPNDLASIEFTFLGLTSLLDPIRPGVPEAVRKCRNAGVKVIMITGDHPLTAKAVAKQAGIITHDTIADIALKTRTNIRDVDPRLVKAIVVTGADLKYMSDNELVQLLGHEEIVFARTDPEQKLRIVEGCQRRHEVVAVTGDGVNDSPALKKANVGIAMGLMGSDVSRDAADMILLDDNFSTIIDGIEEGRIIFDNMKKSIMYTLSSNMPELLPFLLFICIRIPLPISVILILFIDLGTDLLPAISLAYEHPETDIMNRRPRDIERDTLVNVGLFSFSYFQIGMIQALGGLYSYFVVLGDLGYPPWILPGIASDWDHENVAICGKSRSDRLRSLEYAQTAYFVTIVVTQIADLITCKTRKSSIFQHRFRFEFRTYLQAGISFGLK